MTVLEKSEIALIPLFGVGFWLMAPMLPSQLSCGSLLLGLSALLLFQGLVRDLFLLAKARQTPPPPPSTAARCMCLESTVGVTGILLGAVAPGLGIHAPVAMGSGSWSILAVMILATGFFIKDFVIVSRPWRIIRDRHHMNILFRW